MKGNFPHPPVFSKSDIERHTLSCTEALAELQKPWSESWGLPSEESLCLPTFCGRVGRGEVWELGRFGFQSLLFLPCIVYFWPSVSWSVRMPRTLWNHWWLKWMPGLHRCHLLPLSPKHSVLSASTWHAVADCLFISQVLSGRISASLQRVSQSRFSTMFSCLAGGKAMGSGVLSEQKAAVGTRGCTVKSAGPCLVFLTLGPLFHPLPLRAGHWLSFKGSLKQTFLHAQSCGLFGISPSYLGILVS